MYNDSTTTLHKLCHVPKNASVNDFGLPTARENFVNSFASSEKLKVFHTGMFVSTVLPNLVPPRHIDDCFEIHILH